MAIKKAIAKKFTSNPATTRLDGKLNPCPVPEIEQTQPRDNPQWLANAHGWLLGYDKTGDHVEILRVFQGYELDSRKMHVSEARAHYEAMRRAGFYAVPEWNSPSPEESQYGE